MWSLSLEYIFNALVLPFVPLIVLSFVIQRVNTQLKTRYLFLSIGLGLACFPFIVLLQSFMPSSGNMLIALICIKATIEEFVKAVSLYFIPKKNFSAKSFFWMAVLVGATLGSFETIVYQATTWHAIILRTLTAVSLHAVCTGLASFFIWSKHTSQKNIFPLVMAILIHTFYNYFALLTGIYLKWFIFVCIALGLVLCIQNYKMQKKD